jgi:hypothetical protein
MSQEFLKRNQSTNNKENKFKRNSFAHQLNVKEGKHFCMQTFKKELHNQFCAQNGTFEKANISSWLFLLFFFVYRYIILCST